MKKPVALVAMAALFLIGALAGALATHLYYARQLQRPGGPPAMAAERFAMRLERQLELTAEQKQRIDEIIRESHEESRALREQLSPEVRAHMERTHERILEILTPEQREKFEEVRRRNRRRFDQFFLGPGRGRGHGHGPHDRRAVDPSGL